MSQQIRTIIFQVSALLVLAGAALYFPKFEFAPYLFAVGAAGLAITYFTERTEGWGFRRRRLHRFNIFAGILMIAASSLMFMNRKEWVLCLTISALLQLYTAFVSHNEKE